MCSPSWRLGFRATWWGGRRGVGVSGGQMVCMTHFFGFLCLKAYLVPHDLWSAVIRLAPEVARLEDRHGAISLFDAVGMGRASLNKIQAIVDADDQKKDEGSNSILEHVYYAPQSSTLFGVAASWAMQELEDHGSMSDQLEILYFILQAGGGTKKMLCSRYEDQYYLLHDVVDVLRELSGVEDCPPQDLKKTKGLLLYAASIMHDAWCKNSAPTSLFTTIWAAQYMTCWQVHEEQTSRDMGYDISIDHDTVRSVVSGLIEEDPAQLHRFDERSNTPLHVAAGLDCWFGNRHKELYGTSWGYLFRCLLDVDGESPLKCNRAGRLPIHIALSNYMTWDYGVKDLVRSKPATLRIADPLTRLLPFMSAGEEKPNRSRMGCSEDEEVVLGRLETSYRLLREDPAVILLVWNEK